tara:strand:- start:359 stop:631 length:273 start_codon:yes stop_codon:yes gene_type:complete
MSELQKISIRLIPNARQNKILGWDDNKAAGERVLKVQVTAIPEKGKANAALIKLLSKEWKISKSAIKIIRGETNNIKILAIDTDINIIQQ